MQVLTRDGEKLWRVPGASASWSRGGHLAVVTGPGVTDVYDGDGRRLSTLRGTVLAWSPRSESALHADKTSLWVSDIDGKSRRLATTRDPSGFPVAEWSPDGRRIAYLALAPKTRREIAYAVDVATGRRTQLAGYGPWAPDGRRVAFGSYARTVSVADGTHARVVARPGAPIQWVQWLPGGRRLLYTASWDDGVCAKLVSVRAGGGVAARLTSGIPWDAMPAWSPDGTQIAYSHGGLLWNAGACQRSYGNDIWAARADGSQPRRLTRTPDPERSDDASPVWSPKGTQIAFLRTRFSLNHEPIDTAIMVVPAAGGAARTIARGRSPVWSPDGRRIAFVGRARAISVVNSDGRGLRVNAAAAARAASSWLPPDDPQTTPQFWAGNVTWSPEGGKLAFIAGDGDVYTVSPSGGRPARVGPAGLGARGDLAWSPDATRLAYAGDGISVLTVRTGAPVRIDTRQGTAKPAWAPDGRRLAYSVRVNGLRSDVVVTAATGGRAIDVIPGPSEDDDPAWRPRPGR